MFCKRDNTACNVTGTSTTVGLTKKVVDRTRLDSSLCVSNGANASFLKEFGTPYSQHNCELFMYENQYKNW